MRITLCKTTPGFDYVCVLTARIDAGSVLVDSTEERATCKVELMSACGLETAHPFGNEQGFTRMPAAHALTSGLLFWAGSMSDASQDTLETGVSIP
jgi:hypothetical protein